VSLILKNLQATPGNRDCGHVGSSVVIPIKVLEHDSHDFGSDAALTAAKFCMLGQRENWRAIVILGHGQEEEELEIK
jgi:hypothetical protein